MYMCLNEWLLNCLIFFRQRGSLAPANVVVVCSVYVSAFAICKHFKFINDGNKFYFANPYTVGILLRPFRLLWCSIVVGGLAAARGRGDGFLEFGDIPLKSARAQSSSLGI